MPVRTAIRPLRSLLVKLHPYVSCCASCGEIKVPLEGRLCTSLAPAFPVDCVLVGGAQDEAATLHRHMPWLGRVHVIQISPRLATISELADLCGSGLLAEQFFIAFPRSRFQRIHSILDLFTPNGMPLLAMTPAGNFLPSETAWCAFLEKQGLIPGTGASLENDIYPMTGDCVRGFKDAYERFLSERQPNEEENWADIFTALARWCYASAMAVPAGSAHPLSAREPS